MAKDAKGHGSEKRGSSLASVPNSGGKYPAFDKFWAGSAGASVDNKAAQDAAAASELGQGHPKSDAVPVHSGASGRADAFYKNLQDRQRGTVFPKHGYMPNDPGNRAGRKPTDV